MIKNNSEILFLFDAKRCNPNGDMDDENKPRMDKNNKINLVSDVRIKRYIRDYLFDFKGKDIFVTSNAKDAKERGAQLKKQGKKELDCIDVRLFGAVYAQEKSSDHITGPIQFTIAESLNKVELQKSKTITSSFSSQQGIGNDFRVVYSLLSVSSSINKNNAAKSNMDEEDLKLFQEAMVKSIPLSRTRSKLGQYPRLYMQVNLKGNSFLKDLRSFLDLKNAENLLSISDVNLNFKRLVDYLALNKDLIENIEYWADPDLKLFSENEEKNFKEIFGEFTLLELKF